MFRPSKIFACAAALALMTSVAAAQDGVDDLEPTDDPALVPPTEELVTVAVISYDDHPAVEGCLEGLRLGLQQYGYTDGDTLELVHESAEGDADRLDEIVARLSEEGATVVTPIGTVAAQAAASLDAQPVVFCAVPDPINAGLVDSMMHPGSNITGVADAVPLSQQLALIREVMPTVVMLGVLYDPADNGSQWLVDRLGDFLPGAGFQLAEEHVAEADLVEDAARALVEEADVIYVLPDPVVVSALDSVIAVAEETDTPLFVADAQLVERGAIGSRAFNYVEIGKQTADLMARILDGEDAADIPIGQAELTTLIVNVPAAERMGIQLAPGFVARADEVIE